VDSKLRVRIPYKIPDYVTKATRHFYEGGVDRFGTIVGFVPATKEYERDNICAIIKVDSSSCLAVLFLYEIEILESDDFIADD